MSSLHHDGDPQSSHGIDWDHGSHEEFYRYYAKESANSKTIRRFQVIRDTVIRVNPNLISRRPCKVADIGVP